MPTGAGKSLCYQVPAMMKEGITIVISPLISLMKDQVAALSEAGIAAAYINSSLTPPQCAKALRNAREGKYKIIYAAPERLETADFLSMCENVKISLVAVDEAHCVSQWGQDFRPSYLKIAQFIERLLERPTVGAFTATATDFVKEDIKKMLRLENPYVVTTGFDRPNLFFSVEQLRPREKENRLINLINERQGKAGIVYCATRKNVEAVCDFLNEAGIEATRYHAGLPDDERRQNQEDFVYDRKRIMVATNAFGMGIDKSDVSFVIHYNMPKSIENYYQEAGRAGRDGTEADCILLYSKGDVRTNEFLIENSEPNPELNEEEQEAAREKDRERLKQMTFYCTTGECLRCFILKYFGERAKGSCGKCSNCLTEITDTKDVTREAQMILSCIIRTRQRYGKKMICDILRGSENERLLHLGLDTQTTYGLLEDRHAGEVYAIIDRLAAEGYIIYEGIEYPTLHVTEKSADLLYGRAAVRVRNVKRKEKAAVQFVDRGIDEGLMKHLQDLRTKLAREISVPAYVVFSNAALEDMCRKRPKTNREFLAVSGVGNAKLERYGERFMKVIREYEEGI